ncbi:MAG: sigma-54-dependent Fis family transcriptional regulator, partial [Bacteroidales bacterium]|nr:sigma-54-dependent Fis family transcriptional regulator [Bacteroidales bacterium]
TQPISSVYKLRKENYEKEKIVEALQLAKGNKTMAASILNIDRKTLYNKMKLYNLST